MPRLAFEAVPRAIGANGAPISFAKLRVYLAGTTTPVTTYSDRNMASPQSIPVLADSAGVFPQIYVPDGVYKVRISTADNATLQEADWVVTDDGGSAFVTVAAMKAANTLRAGDLVSTLGYYAAGDGGTAQYRIVEDLDFPGSPNGWSDHAITGTTLVAALQGVPKFRHFGARGDGVTNDTAACDAAIAWLVAEPGRVIIADTGVYLVEPAFVLSGTRNKIIGEGYPVFKKADNGNLFWLTGDYNEIRNIAIEGENLTGTAILVHSSFNDIMFCQVNNNNGPCIGFNGRKTTCTGNVAMFNKMTNSDGGFSVNAADYAMVAFNLIDGINVEGLACNQIYRGMVAFNRVTDSSAAGVGGIGTDAATQSMWIGNMSYANAGSANGFKAKEHNGGSSFDILAFNMFVNNPGNGIELETNLTPSGQQGTYSITANVATITVTAGHMQLVGGTAYLNFSGAATDGPYVIATVPDENTFTVPCVAANQSGTVTVGVVDPDGNFARDWAIIGNVLPGNTGGAIQIDAPSGSNTPRHFLAGNMAANAEFAVSHVSNYFAGRPVAFNATATAALTNATGNGTTVVVPFNLAALNEGAGFNTGTNRFVAPRAGYYSFEAAVRVLQTSGANAGIIRLEYFDGTVVTAWEYPMTDSISDELRGMAAKTVHMVEGGTFVVKVRISGLAGDTADVSQDELHTWFSGRAIG